MVWKKSQMFSSDLSTSRNLIFSNFCHVLRYYTEDENGAPKQIYLSEGDKGNIRFYSDTDEDANKFIAPKYYYYPLSKDELVLNPNLKQPIGW